MVQELKERDNDNDELPSKRVVRSPVVSGLGLVVSHLPTTKARQSNPPTKGIITFFCGAVL